MSFLVREILGVAGVEELNGGRFMWKEGLQVGVEGRVDSEMAFSTRDTRGVASLGMGRRAPQLGPGRNESTTYKSEFLTCVCMFKISLKATNVSNAVTHAPSIKGLPKLRYPRSIFYI